MKIGRFELFDDRVMAAIRFIDAISLLPVREPVEVSGARTVRNTSGYTIICAPEPAPAELSSYFSRFRNELAADEPTAGTIPLTLTASVSGGRYLARQFTLALPLQETDSEQPNYLFNPVEVALYPAPIYPLERQWAVIRLRVFQLLAVPLAGVIVSATTAANPNLVLGRGLSDKRGETLIIVPGLRPATMDDPETTVNLVARRDNTNPAFPDPDRLIAAAADAPWLDSAQKADVVIAPGQLTVDQLAMG